MEFVKSLKQAKFIKYIFVALIGSILLAISSKIKIPFYPVPMTMQTFVVLLIGITLGWKLAVSVFDDMISSISRFLERISSERIV